MENDNFNFVVKVIPHSEQRYNTVGDYTTTDGVTTVLVSDMGDWKYEYLIAYHEMNEIGLCRFAGITDQQIDDFDFKFDEDRDLSEGYSEPGDNPAAPYHVQHMFATEAEKKMAKMLNVDWDEYNEAIAEVMLKY